MSKNIVLILLGAVLLYLPTPSGGMEPEGERISVKAIEGSGQDQQSALANAFREAIRHALGNYTLWHATTDGETYDEKIYLNADAVVSDYEIVGREERDGKVFLTINAEIVRNEVMKYIQRIPSVEVGEGELANLLNKRNAIDMAVKSLDLLFINWQENLYRAEKFGPLSIAGDDNLSDEKIKVSIPFILTFRWDAYRVWKTKLMALLDRIAIAKTSGRCKDYEALEDFYAQTSFFKENGANGENPNNYRAVLFLDEWPGPGVGYTLYLVPFQIHQKLSSILNDCITLRINFASPDGHEVMSYSIPGTLAFFQWTSIEDRWRNCFETDDSAIGTRRRFENTFGECLVLREKLKFDGNICKQCLFHAVVSIPSSSIKGSMECTIKCRPDTRENNRSWDRRITTSPLTKEEWQSIDPNPGFLAGGNNGKGIGSGMSFSSTGTGKKLDSENAASPELEALAEALEAAMSAPTGNNYRKLEETWAALPAKAKTATQKNVMWAFCAMLWSKGQTGAVANRRSLINYQAFLEAVTDRCHACGGTGKNRETCRTCGGSGIRRGRCNTCGGSGSCSFCHGSGQTGGRLGGSPLRCPQCGGSGNCRQCSDGYLEWACPDCGGGSRSNKCPTCNGSGRIYSAEKCARVVEENLEQALRICHGEN